MVSHTRMLSIAAVLLLAACERFGQHGVAPRPAPAALRASLGSAAAVQDVGQYLNASYLAHAPDGACRDFRTPTSALVGRRVSAPLPDSSWVTLRVAFGPDSNSIQNVRFERKYADGSVTKYVVQGAANPGSGFAYRGESRAAMRENGAQAVESSSEIGGSLLVLGQKLQRNVCLE